MKLEEVVELLFMSNLVSLSPLFTEPTRPNLKDSSRSNLIDLLFSNQSEQLWPAVSLSWELVSAALQHVSQTLG